MLLLYYLYNVIMQLARIPAGILHTLRADLLTISRPAGVPGVGTCFFAPGFGCIRNYKAHFERPQRLFTGFLYHRGILYHPRKNRGFKRPTAPHSKKVSIFCGQCRIFDISPKIGVCVPILRF